MRFRIACLGLALFLTAAPLHGAAPIQDAPPSPFPEPLAGESITNIEGTEAGEIEIDLNGGLFRSHTTGTARGASVEAEWRALDRLGLMLEAGASSGPTNGTEWNLDLGLSWSLLHDERHSFHLQAEATARLKDEEAGELEGPMELPYAYSAGVRLAYRSGSLTSRAGAGLSFGDGTSAFVQTALLWSFSGDGPWAFAGVEINTNLGAGRPLTVIPQICLRLPAAGVPIRALIGAPFAPALRQGEAPSAGGILRLVWEVD